MVESTNLWPSFHDRSNVSKMSGLISNTDIFWSRVLMLTFSNTAIFKMHIDMICSFCQIIFKIFLPSGPQINPFIIKKLLSYIPKLATPTHLLKDKGRGRNFSTFHHYRRLMTLISQFNIYIYTKWFPLDNSKEIK